MAGSLTMTWAWSDFSATVDKLAWWWWNKYGGDPDEVLAEARLHFCRAFNAWRRDGASFESHIVFCVVRGLRDRRRVEANRSRLARFEPLYDYDQGTERTPLVDLLDSMTADARHVAQLVIDPPAEVRLGIRRLRRPPNRINVQCLLARLLADIGWDRQRVAQAFADLSTAL